MDKITGINNRTTTIACLCALLLSGCLEEAPYATQMLPPAPAYREIPAAPEPRQQLSAAPQIIQAQVMSATPNFKVVPDHRQECKTIEVPVNYEESVQVEQEVPNEDSGHPVMGTVIGGAIGTAVGNQIGNGSGREAARAVLGIFGAVLGNRAGSQPATRIVPVMQTVQRTRYEQQQHCEEVNGTRQEVVGYTVIYNYQGQTLTTTMPNDPGQFVTLLAAR